MEQFLPLIWAVAVLVVAVAFTVAALGAACVGCVWLCTRLLTRYQAAWGSATAFVARQPLIQDQSGYGNAAASDATASGVGTLGMNVGDRGRGRVPRQPEAPFEPTVPDVNDL